MMRKTPVVMLISLILFSLFGFKNKNVATIRIRISGIKNERIYVNKIDLLEGGRDKLVASAKLTSANRFETIKIANSSPSLVYIKFRSVISPIYITNNSVSYVTIDANAQDIDFSFAGSFASVNAYLQEKKKCIESFLPNNLKDIYSTGLDEFKLLNERIPSKIDSLRDKYLPISEENKAFRQFDETDIASLIIMRKILYADYHEYFTGVKMPTQYSFGDLDKDINIDDVNGLLSVNFVDVMSMYIDHLVSKDTVKETLTIKNPTLYFSKKYKLSTSVFSNKELSQFFVSKMLIETLNLGLDTFYSNKLLEARKFFADTKYLHFATKKYSALQTIGKGKKAPNFDMVDIRGEKISLENFKGSNIFINVWSLGCTHSVDELESLNSLVDQFKADEKVVFLNLYFDHDPNELIKYIGRKPLKGINAVLSKSTEKFSNNYFVSTFPRYILIDRGGKIISPFAERPSSPKLIKRLKEIIQN